jgi:Mg2+ and Co2+ transporter CorA
LLSHIKAFIHDLCGIQERIKGLHAMVASREDDLMGVMAIRPILPRSISHAFRQVMQAFILRSKVLSLMTRQKAVSRSPSHGKDLSKRISDKIHELQGLENNAIRQTLSLLDHAKRDIFLSGNTPGDIERRQPQSVGAELLALALICESQNLLLETNAATPQHEENTIALYRRYTSKLHYQANRRPQKRVFLDIHDLEEELDALSTVLGHQKDCLDKFTKSISPETLRLTTATRLTQNKVESWVKDDHLRQLEMREKEIENMKTRSRFLKEQVKQTIEILEEDHGKAIRVFTIVTLFFLPLSFVSSFLGMNTADMRDMSNNQWLFWATGIPVTIFVLALAYIYGYKGDEIRDWMIQRLDNPSSNLSRSEFGRGREDHTSMHESWLPTYKPRRHTDHSRQQPRMPQLDMRLHDNDSGSGSGSGSGNKRNEERPNMRPSVERKETFDSLMPLPPK